MQQSKFLVQSFTSILCVYITTTYSMFVQIQKYPTHPPAHTKNTHGQQNQHPGVQRNKKKKKKKKKKIELFEKTYRFRTFNNPLFTTPSESKKPFFWQNVS